MALKMKKFYNLTFDLLFKLVFGEAWALSVLLSLIWSRLGFKVEIKPEDITYLDPDIQKHHSKKETIQDIFVRVKVNGIYKNVYVDLEMQNNIYEMSYSRLLQYAYHMGSKSMESGESYGESKIELICFLREDNQEKFVAKNKWISTKLLKDEDDHKVATDELKFTFINLQNLSKCNIIELEDIVPLFNSNTEPLKENFKTEYGKGIFGLCMNYNNDDQFITEAFLYEQHDRNIKAKEAKALDRGRAEGLAEKAIAIAMNMLNKNLDINFISECTGLTVKEIEQLK